MPQALVEAQRQRFGADQSPMPPVTPPRD
jgi:hypothetical protein